MTRRDRLFECGVDRACEKTITLIERVKIKVGGFLRQTHQSQIVANLIGRVAFLIQQLITRHEISTGLAHLVAINHEMTGAKYVSELELPSLRQMLGVVLRPQP